MNWLVGWFAGWPVGSLILGFVVSMIHWLIISLLQSLVESRNFFIRSVLHSSYVRMYLLRNFVTERIMKGICMMYVLRLTWLPASPTMMASTCSTTGISLLAWSWADQKAQRGSCAVYAAKDCLAKVQHEIASEHLPLEEPKMSAFHMVPGSCPWNILDKLFDVARNNAWESYWWWSWW